MDVSPQTTVTDLPFPVQYEDGVHICQQTDGDFNSEASGSSYEPLNITTLVVTPHQPSPYEELQPITDILCHQQDTTHLQDSACIQTCQISHVNDQISEEVNPTSISPPSLSVTHEQPIPKGKLDLPRPAVYLDLINETSFYEPRGSISPVVSNFHQVLSTDLEASSIIANSTTDEFLHSILVRMNQNENIRSTSAVEQQYNDINEYDDIPAGHEPLTAHGEQHGIITPPSSPTRPLPDTPLAIYEPLIRNNNNVVSRRMCVLTSKILLMLTAFVIIVVTTVVLHTVVLNMISDKNAGKLLGHQLFICYR